jgi:hypothetical protein
VGVQARLLDGLKERRVGHAEGKALPGPHRRPQHAPRKGAAAGWRRAGNCCRLLLAGCGLATVHRRWSAVLPHITDLSGTVQALLSRMQWAETAGPWVH